MADTVRFTRDPDYFPLETDYTLRYEYTSTEFEGIETVEIKIVSVKSFLNDLLADAALTRTRMGQPTYANYRIKRTPKLVHSEGGVLGFSRMEFPIPPVPGKEWTEAPDAHKIASLEAAIEVPAGKFERCLRINTFLGGGDSGSAIRYYAPGIGYVYEEYSDETWGARVRLLSFNP